MITQREMSALLTGLAPVINAHLLKLKEAADKQIAELDARLAGAEAVIARLIENPPKGEKGEPGIQGVAGIDGLNGRDGANGLNGIDGIDGKDGSAGRDGTDGSPGLPGINGKDGFSLRDFDTEMMPDGKTVLLKWISGDIEETHELAFTIRDGIDGTPGIPGCDGKDAEQIDYDRLVSMLDMPLRTFIADHLEVFPPAAGETGEPGKDGAAGRDGIDGAPGHDASPVTRQQLVEILSDDDTPLRIVVADHLRMYPPASGRDGQPGVPGHDGKPGADGKDGRDGVDGFGFDDLVPEFDGERTLTIKFYKDEREHVKQFTIVLPIPIDRGQWKPGQYERGDVVTHGGSAWIAQCDTDSKPETSPDWRLSVKRGRDGKDGKDGQKGERGLPGKDGKWQSGS